MVSGKASTCSIESVDFFGVRGGGEVIGGLASREGARVGTTSEDVALSLSALGTPRDLVTRTGRDAFFESVKKGRAI